MDGSEEVWLVKVPEFVAERWRAVHQAGGSPVELGRVRNVQNADQTTDQVDEMHLTLSGATAENIPQKYRLRQTTGDMAAMHYISQEDGRTCLEAPVEQRFDAEMAANAGLDEAYRKRVNERTAATAKQKRMKVMTVDEANKVRDRLTTAVGSSSRIEAAASRKEKGIEKRERADHTILQNMLFKLFEQQSAWNFVQLMQHTNQPAAWLKEVLQEIAAQSKRGPHKGLWELNKAYNLKK